MPCLTVAWRVECHAVIPVQKHSRAFRTNAYSPTKCGIWRGVPCGTISNSCPWLTDGRCSPPPHQLHGVHRSYTCLGVLPANLLPVRSTISASFIPLVWILFDTPIAVNSCTNLFLSLLLLQFPLPLWSSLKAIVKSKLWPIATFWECLNMWKSNLVAIVSRSSWSHIG